ncbi:M23 family metallopeptidase [Patescibacteria group bacterium]|nr:M23 family metallopeptidase [Patescibacteria group bacterium]
MPSNLPEQPEEEQKKAPETVVAPEIVKVEEEKKEEAQLESKHEVEKEKLETTVQTEKATAEVKTMLKIEREKLKQQVEAKQAQSGEAKEKTEESFWQKLFGGGFGKFMDSLAQDFPVIFGRDGLFGFLWPKEKKEADSDSQQDTKAEYKKGSRKIERREDLPNNSELKLPLQPKYSVTSDYQSNRVIQSLGIGPSPHKGVDIGTPEGTKLFSPGDGRVVYKRPAGSSGGNALHVEYKVNGEYVVMVFHHLKELPDLEPGSEIKKGELLAVSGNTAAIKNGQPMSTGPHLHFEVRKSSGDVMKGAIGDPLDPYHFLPDFYKNQMLTMRSGKTDGMWTNEKPTAFA